MRGKQYRMKTPTLAILSCGDQRIPVTIPQGGTVEVEVELNGNRLVDVRWEGKMVMMFTIDIQTRGELVKTKSV